MKARQAKKIVKQPSPSETDPKSGSYWYRHRRANDYINRLFSRRFSLLSKRNKGYSRVRDVLKYIFKDNNRILWES